MDYLQNLIATQFLANFVGGSFILSVFYSLREFPVKLWDYLVRSLTVRVLVCNDDIGYEKVVDWLSQPVYIKSLRELRIRSQNQREPHTGKPDIHYAIGMGTHYIWHRGRLLRVKREESKDSGASWNRREDISLTTLGRSTLYMRKLVSEIANTDNTNETEVYVYQDGWWSLACRKVKRNLDTIVLPSEQKSRIIKDMAKFLRRRSWYAAKGVPYRRGYLFEGKPGCGKTTMVLGMAAHFSLPLYVLNLGSVREDNDLFKAFTLVPERALLLIEDVDATQHKRVGVAKAVKGKSQDPPEAKKITLSGFLNQLDGAFSKEGRITIMTTNHPELLDPAVVRASRIDLRETFGDLGPSEVQQMCQNFLGEDLGLLRAQDYVDPISPAELQRHLQELTIEE